MTAASTDNHIFNHKDAEILAKAARVPFAAIGSILPGPQGSIRLRLGVGLPAGDAVPQVPTSDIVRLVRRLAAASAAAERDRMDSEINIEMVEGSQQAVAWLKSDRCLVATWYPIFGTTPFVTLVGPSVGTSFPRWQQEMARLALMQESERMNSDPARTGTPEGEILASVLDRLTMPIAVVDRDGRTVYSNEAAQTCFKAARVLRLADGRVASPIADINNRLHVAIRAATSGINRQSHVLLLPGDPDDAPLGQKAVVVTPIAASQGLALIVCADGCQDGAMLNLMLSELGLTPTEQRLASRLVSGDCLEDAAEQINIKVSTARSYLRNIFDKTGTSRQSQLVALALLLTPPASVADLPVAQPVAGRCFAPTAGLRKPSPLGSLRQARTS